MIKKIEKIALSIIMLFALTVTTALAQPGGGGGGGMGGGPGGMGGRPEGGMQQGGVPNILESAGYFELDAEEIIKRIKVKDEAKKTAIRKVVILYTEGYEGVGLKYSADIEAIKEVQKSLEDSQEQGDRSSMRTMMQSISENTQNIRTDMVALHKKFSEEDMPALLDEKESDRWTKYYASYCQTKGFRLNQQQRRERGEGENGENRPQRQQREE